MKKYWLYFLLIFIFIGNSVSAESIHFTDYIYKIKTVNNTGKQNFVENIYYTNNEDGNNWSSRFDVYYYPGITNPLKYAQQISKDIENNDKLLLLKFVQNKKQNVALISYLETSEQNGQTVFVYNIFKYQARNKKGIDILRFEKIYSCSDKTAIINMTEEIRKINDDYMERMIITPIPEIITDNIKS